MTTFILPYQGALPVGDELFFSSLHIEAVLGYADASESSGDIYTGAFLAAATSIETDWLTYSGLIGAGLNIDVTDELTLTPIANVGIAYLRNETDYGGPGAAFTAALANGIAFNWDAWVLSAGVAARAGYVTPITDTIGLELIGRYDVRWSETIDTDASAQEFSTTSEFLTLRSDLTGPTGQTLLGREVDWRGTIALRAITRGDLYGTQYLVEIGAGLEVSNDLPIAQTLSITTAVFLGDRLTGWSVGVSVGF